MNKRFLMFAATVSMVFCSSAKVRLPHLIGDGMVIQQNSDVRLWGWDKPGKKVKVSTSWSSATYESKTGSDGRWMVSVKSPEASFTPLSITFDDGEQTTINNVLSGEVWVCAGQSNMEMPVKGFGQCPVKDYNLEVINAADGIRSAKIPSRMSTKPLDDADTQWRVSSPATVGEFSATGYFFARLVRKALNVPVGLIEANKGGSRVESWLDESNLRKYTKEDLDSATMNKRFQWDFHYPLLWGNATFHPILNYTIKGIIYYQGCSNVGDPAGQYTERLKMLVEQWRRDFREGEIPFYFVQIAPYVYGDGIEGTSGAKLREQQFNATKVIPNSGMVCTNDLVYPYEKGQIHPAQKQQVGERLAFLALNKTYGMKSVICESMTFKDMIIQDGKAYLSFDNLAEGYSRWEDIQGFEIAGEDRVFHKATAEKYWAGGNDPRNERIAVSSPEVKHPVAVRYCFKNFEIGNLANQGGLPLVPFRTDNWE
ncbi:MAG: sialate O-acetylesterase [Prevotella sp.]|nr:sialate O-acetylesterase [Prevotella sp.]